MYDENIGVSKARIQACIQSIPGDSFTTADVIRRYLGHFSSDLRTPPSYSFNALFGRILKRNDEEFGIEEFALRHEIQDDHGNKTTTSLWRRRV